MQATNGFAHLIQALSQLSSLLAGPASDEEAAAQEALGQAVGQAAAAAAEVAVLAGAALDIEKEQLRDEVGGKVGWLHCAATGSWRKQCQAACAGCTKWNVANVGCVLLTLLAQVSRLRSQLRALVDKAAGAAGAASMELQVR